MAWLTASGDLSSKVNAQLNPMDPGIHKVNEARSMNPKQTRKADRSATSRNKGQKAEPPSRKKSCVECSQAKTRCSLQFPSCERCAMRGIQCEYEKLGANPYYVAQTKAFQRHRQQLDTFLLSSSLDTNMIGLPAASYVDANLLSTLELPAANGDLPSNSITPPINSDNNCFHYLDMTTLQADGQSPHTFGSNASSSDHSNANLSPPESTSIRDSSATSLVSKQSREYAGSVSSPSLHPIDLRIHDSVLKAFQPSTVVIDILKSYPRMLLHARSSPPFIHRAMYPTALPNELAKAINLVNDFESATPDNEEAAFSAVATEQLSLMQAWYRHPVNDPVDAIGVLHAMLMYQIILCLFGDARWRAVGQGHHNELLQFCRVVGQTGLDMPVVESGHCPSWKEWIEVETKRRTMFAVFLLDGVMTLPRGAVPYVCPQITTLPLPASASLWKAQNEQAFASAWTLADHGGIPPTLHDLEHGNQHSIQIQKWLADLDEFGRLLMMAASHICRGGGEQDNMKELLQTRRVSLTALF